MVTIRSLYKDGKFKGVIGATAETKPITHIGDIVGDTEDTTGFCMVIDTGVKLVRKYTVMKGYSEVEDATYAEEGYEVREEQMDFASIIPTSFIPELAQVVINHPGDLRRYQMRMEELIRKHVGESNSKKIKVVNSKREMLNIGPQTIIFPGNPTDQYLCISIGNGLYYLCNATTEFRVYVRSEMQA